MPSILNGADPIRPAGSHQILGLGGVSCQPDTQDGEILLGEVFSHPTHFLWCPCETVDEQTTNRITLKVEWLCSGNYVHE